MNYYEEREQFFKNSNKACVFEAGFMVCLEGTGYEVKESSYISEKTNRVEKAIVLTNGTVKVYLKDWQFFTESDNRGENERQWVKILNKDAEKVADLAELARVQNIECYAI